MNHPIRSTRGPWSPVRTLAALALLAGCGGTLGPVGPESELDQNRARWEATRSDDYRYAIRRLCFCGPDAIGPVWVDVSGDDVLERTYVDSGDPVAANVEELFPTVDELFHVIQDAYDRDAENVTVTYEATTGLPIDVFIDYSLQIADEELGFAVTQLPGPLPR